MKCDPPHSYTPSSIDQLCINTIRFLSIDAVQKANSGRPGMPMGAAPMPYILWDHFLRNNLLNRGWFNRDCFVLSTGHASMLPYSLLHLSGYVVIGDAQAWELIQTLIDARFSGAERHYRRLDKISALEMEVQKCKSA